MPSLGLDGRGDLQLWVGLGSSRKDQGQLTQKLALFLHSCEVERNPAAVMPFRHCS